MWQVIWWFVWNVGSHLPPHFSSQWRRLSLITGVGVFLMWFGDGCRIRGRPPFINLHIYPVGVNRVGLRWGWFFLSRLPFIIKKNSLVLQAVLNNILHLHMSTVLSASQSWLSMCVFLNASSAHNGRLGRCQNAVTIRRLAVDNVCRL